PVRAQLSAVRSRVVIIGTLAVEIVDPSGQVRNEPALAAVEREREPESLVLEVAPELDLIIRSGLTQLEALGGTVGQGIGTPDRGGRTALGDADGSAAEPTSAELRYRERIDGAAEHAERDAAIPAEGVALDRSAIHRQFQPPRVHDSAVEELLGESQRRRQ